MVIFMIRYHIHTMPTTNTESYQMDVEDNESSLFQGFNPENNPFYILQMRISGGKKLCTKCFFNDNMNIQVNETTSRCPRCEKDTVESDGEDEDSENGDGDDKNDGDDGDDGDGDGDDEDDDDGNDDGNDDEDDDEGCVEDSCVEDSENEEENKVQQAPNKCPSCANITDTPCDKAGHCDEYCAYLTIKKTQSCQGCVEDQPNQLAHMDPGGCLYSIACDMGLVEED